MTGPEHYREAESALNQAAFTDYGTDDERSHLARAQVHATLALAAATAMNDYSAGKPDPDFYAWQEAAGTKASS